MNSGPTQVIMMRFKVKRRTPYNSRLPVNVRLTYYDLEQKRQVVKLDTSFLTVTESSSALDMLKDGEVGKNFQIALLAQGIRDMAPAYESGRFKEAERLLTAAIAGTYQRYPNLEDEDITRTLMVAQKYQEALRKQNQRREAKGDR